MTYFPKNNKITSISASANSSMNATKVSKRAAHLRGRRDMQTAVWGGIVAYTLGVVGTLVCLGRRHGVLCCFQRPSKGLAYN